MAILERHRNRPVNEVAPLVGELKVHPADKLFPGEVRVLIFRTGNRNEVAQGVGTELMQEISDKNSGTTRVRHL